MNIYIALHEDLQTDATIINGSYNLPPHITLPVTFVYDGSPNGSNWANLENFLDNGYYPAINDSFKVLYGTTYYRDLAPCDTSTGIRVRGIYSLPATLQSGFVLQSIDGDGNIIGSYNNTTIALKSGEKWSSPVATEIRSGNGTGIDQKPFSYTASFNTTWTIANLGIFGKANLTRYNNSATGVGYTRIFVGADPAEGR